MTPEQAAATSGTQTVTPPTDECWEQFKEFALHLQTHDADTDFIVAVRRLQKLNPWLLGMAAWHGIVAQETQLRRLALQSLAEWRAQQ